MSIQNLQVFLLNNEGNNPVSEGKKDEYDNWENHLDVRPWVEAKDAEDHQLAQLAQCEEVHLPLRHPPDVVVWWIGALLSEEQHDPLKHLVPGEGCDGQVQEETIKDCRWHEVEQLVQEQHGQSNECVAENVGQSCFSHSDNNGVDITVLNSFLGVSKTFHMKRGVGEACMEKGKAKHAEEEIYQANSKEVPVVCSAFQELVVRAVDHGCTDVLIHEEEE